MRGESPTPSSTPSSGTFPGWGSEAALSIAITRGVSASISRCEITHAERAVIDVDRARDQHAAYERCLATLGCRIVQLPAADAFPDAVFVEDVAVVLDEVAVITRPGAASRRGETELIKPALTPYRRLEHIEGPATLDGGDVLVSGRRVFAGRSTRTNEAGIRQLDEILRPLGYETVEVNVSGCLHLKTCATLVARETVLVNPHMVDTGTFAGMTQIEVAATEPMAANALWIGAKVVFPAAYPQTQKRLLDAGIDVVAIDAHELAKAEGGLTCCSLIFEGSAE